MSAAWVAGGVRARALLGRRLGADAAHELAAAPDLDSALRQLADGPYGRDLRPGLAMAEIERAIGAGLLWQLRVLAGWQPRAGAQIVRALAGWFVLANVLDHARALAGEPVTAPYRLGALDIGWTRLATTTTAAQLRAALTRSPWGDPGDTSLAAIALAGRLRWAAWAMGIAPTAAEWAAGALALMAAGAWFADERPPPDTAAEQVAALLGTDPRASGSIAEFAGRARPRARWALRDTTHADQLWRAEAGWWARLEADGRTMTRGAAFGGEQLAGCVALLAVDAWRVRAALQVVGTPGADGLAVFDALA